MQDGNIIAPKPNSLPVIHANTTCDQHVEKEATSTLTSVYGDIQVAFSHRACVAGLPSCSNLAQKAGATVYLAHDTAAVFLYGSLYEVTAGGY